MWGVPSTGLARTRSRHIPWDWQVSLAPWVSLWAERRRGNEKRGCKALVASHKVFLCFLHA